MLAFNYVLHNSGILLIDFIKDLRIFLDSKLYFYQHADYLFSHAIKLLGLIRTIHFFMSSLNSFLLLHISLAKVEYASVV
jgi:hypothetical protein